MLHHSKFSLFALLVLMCVVVSSCTTTKTLSSDPSVAEEITLGTETNAAAITFTDGHSVHEAFHIAVRADSTEWYGKNREWRNAVATARIQSISFEQSHALKGLLTGAEIGLALGAFVDIIAASSSGFLGPGNWNASYTNALLGVAGVFTVVGGIVGLVAGAPNVEEEYVSSVIANQSTIDTIPLGDTTQTKLPH